MELRTYAKIIWRYSWLIILIVAVVAIYSGYQYDKLRKTPGALTQFSSNITLQIGLQATTAANFNPADNETLAETLADTLVNGPILSSNAFCSDIAHQIGLDADQIQQNYPGADLGNIQPAAIAGAITTTRIDSLVMINVNWLTAAGAWAITNAIGEVSSARIGQYLNYVIVTDNAALPTDTTTEPAVAARIISAASPAGAVPGPDAGKRTILLLLPVIALVIGIALAFLLDYLDDRIRTREDITDLLELPIYGEVPHAPVPGHSARSSRDQEAVG